MCGYNHPVTQLLVVAHDVVCVCVCVCVAAQVPEWQL